MCSTFQSRYHSNIEKTVRKKDNSFISKGTSPIFAKIFNKKI
jgi:hypothetical protein